MFSKIVLIFERVGDGCYHSYLFNIRSVGITVVDRELTLVSLCDFVELAVAICCKLLSSSLGIVDSTSGATCHGPAAASTVLTPHIEHTLCACSGGGELLVKGAGRD